MKYLLTLLAMFVLTSSAHAQQYKNVLQIPKLAEEGYKGKIKKVTIEAYEARMVSGRLIKRSLSSTVVDSFDTNGYLIKKTYSPSNSVTTYTYNSDKEYISSMTKDGDKNSSKTLTKNLSANSYIESTYFYSDKKKDYNTEPDKIDTIYFNHDNQVKSWAGDIGPTIIERINSDTTITSIYNGYSVYTSVILERDQYKNKLKQVDIPDTSSKVQTTYLSEYSYEYY